MTADSEVGRSARSLLSVRQVAKLLGVCRATVYELCDQRTLPHFRVLNSIRIDPGAVKRFLASARRRSSTRGRSGGRTASLNKPGGDGSSEPAKSPG